MALFFDRTQEEELERASRILLEEDLANAIRGPEWFDDAKCRDSENPNKYVDVMFPDGNSGHGANHLFEARKICLQCPVRYKCLEFGLDEQFGIWGGHSLTQRKRIIALVKKGSSLEEASRQIDARSRDARRQ